MFIRSKDLYFLFHPPLCHLCRYHLQYHPITRVIAINAMYHFVIVVDGNRQHNRKCFLEHVKRHTRKSIRLDKDVSELVE